MRSLFLCSWEITLIFCSQWTFKAGSLQERGQYESDFRSDSFAVFEDHTSAWKISRLWNSVEIINTRTLSVFPSVGKFLKNKEESCSYVECFVAQTGQLIGFWSLLCQKQNTKVKCAAGLHPTHDKNFRLLINCWRCDLRFVWRSVLCKKCHLTQTQVQVFTAQVRFNFAECTLRETFLIPSCTVCRPLIVRRTAARQPRAN